MVRVKGWAPGLRLAVLLSLLPVIAGSGCHRGVHARPDIVLVTIDALRADHTSVYGYGRDTTPFLARLARQSLVFESAYATASWTAPSMASLFTSLPARSHGVVSGFLAGGRPAANHDVLGEDFQTLAEVLRGQGYRTFGVSTNGHLSAATGFAQGFDTLAEASWEDSPAANALAAEMAAEIAAAEHYFLWIHYFDPHSPYRARSPWIRQYAGGKQGYERWAGRSAPYLERNAARFASDDEARAALVALYDSEIAAVDAAIEELFAKLAIGKKELIVVTADHGEAFAERGRMGHGSDVFEEQIRVPLMLRLPEASATAVVAEPVSLVDVYPTLAAAAGAEVRPGLEGVDLREVAAGRASERALVAEIDRKGRSARALRLGRWKINRQRAPQAFTRLYDLQTDRGELRDLFADRPDEVAALASAWKRWKARWPRRRAERIAEPLTPEQVERLRALGYAR